MKDENVSDESGHYDIDGVSLACGHVIVGSTGETFECADQRIARLLKGESNGPNV